MPTSFRDCRSARTAGGVARCIQRGLLEEGGGTGCDDGSRFLKGKGGWVRRVF
ncbi:hypothetical protein Esi_0060_0027 [Ectocarpus siliculosus]|uniref:Uncharacterized protein n=1 Tax=Ectocarpus siliculosus TaxID=2880 RepID=D8LQQ5_ECTSI|nr:hypothetical protein Esi_0060_0027 [Ectocarpus siliculosus]|eukprot:CBN74932.1 hypothetical protein Esi_0060_0027 [Ectocarpus siliculosus]